MNNHKKTELKRLISGIIAVMMLIIVLFSAFYIASEAVHDCCGEDCPVCTCIQSCMNTLKSIGISFSGQYHLLILSAGILLSLKFLKVFIPDHSLISQKIRMNN